MIFTLSRVMKELRVMCYLMNKSFRTFTSLYLEFSSDKYLHFLAPLRLKHALSQLPRSITHGVFSTRKSAHS